MDETTLYSEETSSKWTEALFLALMVVFLWLIVSRLPYRAGEIWIWVFAGLFLLFGFYARNYRTLLIRVTTESLQLRFGLFHWRIPLGNIAACRPDDALTPLQRYGGAGIHFMLVNGRYRASWNFLEHDRLVISFKRKVGLVEDLSFSTRYPEKLLPLIESLGKN